MMNSKTNMNTEVLAFIQKDRFRLFVERNKFKALADKVIKDLMASGEINKIYEKWFLKPIPPKNITMGVPMSPNLKKVIAKPTDSPDPAVYH